MMLKRYDNKAAFLSLNTLLFLCAAAAYKISNGPFTATAFL